MFIDGNMYKLISTLTHATMNASVAPSIETSCDPRSRVMVRFQGGLVIASISFARANLSTIRHYHKALHETCVNSTIGDWELTHRRPHLIALIRQNVWFLNYNFQYDFNVCEYMSPITSHSKSRGYRKIRMKTLERSIYNLKTINDYIGKKDNN